MYGLIGAGGEGQETQFKYNDDDTRWISIYYGMTQSVQGKLIVSRWKLRKWMRNWQKKWKRLGKDDHEPKVLGKNRDKS